MYAKIIKPILDMFIAFFAFLFLLPLFLLMTFLLAIANTGKPFFFQLRPGKNEKIFKIIKFKTMNDKKDEKGNLLPDEERITKVGKFVRRTSLDEIPQLLNVIKGDMSLIGPRPLLIEYLSLYNQNQKRRHDVKPGITGWAQINGRNTISHTQKFEMDVWYVDHLSFLLDLKIFYLTILKVIKKDGIEENAIDSNGYFNGEN